MKRLIGILFICLAAGASPADILRVDVPAHTRWCRVIKVDVSQMTDAKRYEDALRQGIEPLESCARARGLRAIGIPWVTATTVDAAAAPPTAEVTLCTVVPAGAVPCAEQLSGETAEPARVLAAVCPEELAEQCREEIRAALAAEPWKLEAAAIDALSWRIAQAPGGASTAQNVVSALTASDAQMLRSANQTGTAHAPVRAPFVAVVAVVDAVPAQ